MAQDIRQIVTRPTRTAADDLNLYMLEDDYARDPRKQRIDLFEQELIGKVIADCPAGWTLLDVPCGNGRITQLVTRDDLNILPIDYGEPILAGMAKRCPDAKFLPWRTRGDVMRLPLPDKCIDLTLNFRLAHHFHDRAALLAMYRELVRVTRHQLITTFWSSQCWRVWRRKLRGKKLRGYPVSPAWFTAVCEEAGLVVERMVPVRRFVEEECIVFCRIAGAAGRDSA